MSSRDKSLIALVVMLVIAVGGYFVVVSPEHHKATQLTSQISTEQASLDQAESRLVAGEAAQAKYLSYARQLKTLSTAVPGDAQIPGLIDELQAASSTNHVTFQTVSLGGAGTATAATAAASSATASFPSQSFSLSFTGSYAAVANLLGTLDSFVRADDANFRASGRLLSISSVSLSPESSTSRSGDVTASVSAADYDVPSALGAGA